MTCRLVMGRMDGALGRSNEDATCQDRRVLRNPRCNSALSTIGLSLDMPMQRPHPHTRILSLSLCLSAVHDLGKLY